MAVVLCWLAPALVAGPVLKLTNGREVAGEDLRREGDLYMLVIAGGAVIPIPSGVVKEVAWTEEADPAASPSAADSNQRSRRDQPAAGRPGGRPASASPAGSDGEDGGGGGRADVSGNGGDDGGDGALADHAATAGGDAGGWNSMAGRPSGGGSEHAGDGTPVPQINRAQIAHESGAQSPPETEDRRDEVVTDPRRGRTLAGGGVAPSSASEQLAVFGKPSEFPKDVVHFDLQPSYWVMDPDEHIGTPSKWTQPPRDPTWTPTSGFDPNEDVMASSRTEWREPSSNSAWQPSDGFAKD